MTIDIHAFLISWTGMHQNAIKIAEKVSEHVENCTLIYSDEDNEYRLSSKACEPVRLSNECFWGRKFEKCISSCKNEILLIIHADADCEDWPRLIERCRHNFRTVPNMGVYAPLISFTHWDLNKTRFARTQQTLSIVAQTDGIVFGIAKPAWERLKAFDYSRNNLGWGIDWALMAYCYANKMFAVVDESIEVTHPESTGYNSTEAKRQEREFLNQLDTDERIQYFLLSSFVSSRKTIINSLKI